MLAKRGPCSDGQSGTAGVAPCHADSPPSASARYRATGERQDV